MQKLYSQKSEDSAITLNEKDFNTKAKEGTSEGTIPDTEMADSYESYYAKGRNGGQKRPTADNKNKKDNNNNNKNNNAKNSNNNNNGQQKKRKL